MKARGQTFELESSAREERHIASHPSVKLIFSTVKHWQRKQVTSIGSSAGGDTSDKPQWGRLITLKLLTSLMAQLMSFGTNRQLDNWTVHNQIYRPVGKTAERISSSLRDNVMIEHLPFLFWID